MQKKIIGATLVYAFFNFLQPLISFLLQPFFLHYFNVNDYSIHALMTNYATLVGIISTFSLSGSYTAFAHHYQAEKKNYLAQTLVFGIYTSLIFFVISCLVGTYIFKYIFINSPQLTFFPYGLSATLIGIGTAIYTPFITYLRNEKLLKWYIFWYTATTLISTALQIFLVAHAQISVQGSQIGRAVGVWTGVIITFFYIRKNLVLKVEYQKYVLPQLKFLKYWLPNTLAAWAYNSLDRFLIERILNLSLVAIYGFLNVLAGTIEMAYNTVRSAILPNLFTAYQLNAQHQTTTHTQKLYTFYAATNIFFISSITLLVSNIQYFITKKNYLEIQQYIFLYSIGYIFSALTFLASSFFLYQKASKKWLQYTLLGLGVNLLLNLFLIPQYKILGVVIAFVIARLSMFLGIVSTNILFWQQINFPIMVKINFFICIIALTNHFLVNYYHYISPQQAGVVQFLLIIPLLLYVYATTIKK